MRECINMSLTLNNCIDCRLLQHYPALSLPVFPAACERLAPRWPGLTPGMMVMTEDGHLPCSPASDAGRNLVFSNGLDHSYLETLNIPGLWEHLDWIRSRALTCLLGLSACEGTKRKTRRKHITKCRMFANVFLMHDCQHPCVGTAEAGKDLGKLSWPIPALAADPAQGWHCPSSQLCNLQTCGNIVPGSRMLACWLVKLFYFTSLSPSSLFGDTWCWIFAKSGEFSDHFLVFCFCPIWCDVMWGEDVTILLLLRPGSPWPQLEPAAWCRSLSSHFSHLFCSPATFDIHQHWWSWKFPRKMRMIWSCQKCDETGQ